MFFKGSRYENVKTDQTTDGTGRVVKYKRTHFISETPAVFRHTVVEGDRLDLIAYRYYKDPELFWRICDANVVMLPDELVAEVGRRILIPAAVR